MYLAYKLILNYKAFECFNVFKTFAKKTTITKLVIVKFLVNEISLNAMLLH